MGRKGGMELVEWLIIAAIIGLLVAIAAPAFVKAFRGSSVSDDAPSMLDTSRFGR
jgi:Tfp pilus assembly protein FimT